MVAIVVLGPNGPNGGRLEQSGLMQYYCAIVIH